MNKGQLEAAAENLSIAGWLYRKDPAHVKAATERLLSIKGNKTPDEFHKELGLIMWNNVGMARTEQPAFSLWARKSRSIRPAQRPGYGAWRASMMPR